eukprot:TCONS_00051471-protein
MRSHLSHINWSIEFIQKSIELNVNESLELFLKQMIELRNLYVPLTHNKNDLSNKRRKGKHPLDPKICQIIKEKRKAHRKWIISLQNDDTERRRREYVRWRNAADRALTRSKREFEKKISEQSKTNPKRFWKYVRSNLKARTGIHPLLENPNNENSIKYDDKSKANILQRQFCSVFTREPLKQLPEFHSRTDKEVEINILTETIKKELKALNPNKSMGPDELHPRMLKELAEYIAEPLFLIMTKSLNESCLPNDWKHANVSPVYKKGNKNIAENYRPISL